MANKNINERCPLSGECGKKTCDYQHKELECSYYYGNARPDFEIEDQEALRGDPIDYFDNETEDKLSSAGTLVYLSVSEIYPHPDNPRKDVGDLDELIESIKANGILQNLTVVPGHWVGKEEFVDMAKAEGISKVNAASMWTPKEDWLERGYTIIIGHRRLAAAKAAGLSKVPCVIANLTEKEQLSTMLTENMQRVDLTVFEQASGFQMMLDLGDTMDEIADKSGFSKTTVRRRLEIAKLDDKIMKKVSGRQIAMADFDELAKIDDIETRNKVLSSIGTSNFKNEVQNALQQQKLKERMNEWLEVITKFAVKIEKSDYAIMEYCGNFAYYNLSKEAIVPEDADAVNYFYVQSEKEIDLYKERNMDAEAAKKAEEDERRRLSEEEKNRFIDISRRHFGLRADFVKDLSNAKCKKNIGAITAILANTMQKMSSTWNSPNMDAKILSYVLGVAIEEDETGLLTESAGIRSAIEAFPEKTIFCLAYSAIDSAGVGYWKSIWEDGRYQYRHCASENLDMVYEALVALGYEMSDEEKAMQNGSHEVFKRPDEHNGEADRAGAVNE